MSLVFFQKFFKDPKTKCSGKGDSNKSSSWFGFGGKPKPSQGEIDMS